MCVPCVRYKELASLADAWSCELRNTNRRCWFRYWCSKFDGMLNKHYFVVNDRNKESD